MRVCLYVLCGHLLGKGWPLGSRLWCIIWHFDPNPRVRGLGSVGKIFATMLLHSWFPLIRYMADLLALVWGVYCEFVTFPLISWVGCGTWLYRFLIFAPLLTMTLIWKSWVLTFWPLGSGGSADKMFGTMLLHFVIPFNLICNMTMLWKSWILTYWPHPKGRGLRTKYLLPCCCNRDSL